MTNSNNDVNKVYPNTTGSVFEKDSLDKYLLILKAHESCPKFESEAVELMKNFIASLNASQMIPGYVFQLRIGVRSLSKL